MRKAHLAIFALLGTTILWAFQAIIARATVLSMPVFTVHFLRMSTAFLFFLPFFLIKKPWKNKHFKSLLKTSLFAAGNMTFFISGVKYTSASASQLIYAAIPILVVFSDIFFLRKKFSITKTGGVLLGFLGILFIVLLSGFEKEATMSGSLVGNLIISLGVFCWFNYLLSSKKLSQYFTPLELGSSTIIVSFLTSIPLFLVEKIMLTSSFSLNLQQGLGIFYLGFVGTFITYLLYQFAIRYTSALNVSLTSYIQPIFTALLAGIILAEKLTFGFAFGSILVFLGVFMTSTLNFVNNHKTHT